MAEKTINYALIRPDDADGHDLYRRLGELICMPEHEHLADARIALVWRWGWTKSKDGQVILGQCKKCSDLEREFHEYDFAIMLNNDLFPNFAVEKQDAILHHELCHAARDVDSDGEPKIDDRGRAVWRIRKHDLEEFEATVRRYGLYRDDVKRFMDAGQDGRRGGLQRQANQIVSLYRDAEGLAAEAG